MRAAPNAGFTLIELLTVMAVVGILVGLTAINVSKMDRNIYGSVSIVTSLLGAARAQAISTTSVVRVNLSSNLLTFSGNSTCSASSGWTALPALAQPLPQGITLSSTTLTADPVSGSKTLLTCFTARGTTALPGSVTLADTSGHTATATIYVTGSVQ